MATGTIKAYSPILTTRNHTSSAFNAPAGSGGRIDIPIGLEGYLPLGIIRMTGSSNSGFSYSDWYLASNATASVYYRNNAGDKTGSILTITVLYVKN